MTRSCEPAIGREQCPTKLSLSEIAQMSLRPGWILYPSTASFDMERIDDPYFSQVWSDEQIPKWTQRE